ncbi:UNVERIFIED_CONTAM: hypothetical protein FKN15_032696 [Acipenser sinensis]
MLAAAQGTPTVALLPAVWGTPAKVALDAQAPPSWVQGTPVVAMLMVACGTPSLALDRAPASSLAFRNCCFSPSYALGQAVPPIPLGMGSIPPCAQTPHRQGTNLGPPPILPGLECVGVPADPIVLELLDVISFDAVFAASPEVARLAAVFFPWQQGSPPLVFRCARLTPPLHFLELFCQIHIRSSTFNLRSSASTSRQGVSRCLPSIAHC